MMTINEQHRVIPPQLNVPPRLLLGPGPSNANPRVLQALAMSPVGHLDPYYLQVMDEVQTLLRYAWQDVQKLTKPWGQVFSLDELRQGLENYRPNVLALVHAETSTGARQPLEGVGELCREYNCLLLVDSVTSLGGVPLFLDDWGVDLSYSCSQKGIGCPPGLGPFTMSPRAVEKLENRRTKVTNWYLDITLLSQYWGKARVYHHTAPVNMNYALREALRILAEEGLENSWNRHQQNAELLWEGLTDLGLTCHVEKEFRLPTLTTVRIPEGVDGKAIARQLLTDYNIEIGNGLGELAGQVWRIGLMGYNSRPENVLLLLQALKRVLNR